MNKIHFSGIKFYTAHNEKQIIRNLLERDNRA